jgi:hypothetical protein
VAPRAPRRPRPAARPNVNGMRTAPLVLVALLAALVLGVTARDLRPAPFGDDLVARSAAAVPADALRRGADRSVQAYDTRTGRPVWSYRRRGRTPLELVAAAGTTVAVWDDGMLTGVRPDQPAVRWHRYVPGLAGWLARLRRAHALDRGVLLAPLGAGGTFLVLTPGLVVTYTTADGAIRTDTLSPPGCSYAPTGALRAGDQVVVARPCAVRSTVEAFGADGRSWQSPATPLAVPVRRGAGLVGVGGPPLLRPALLDLRSGLAALPPARG